MDYHAKNISEDCVLWITLDGYALNNIKETWPIFKDEPHNARLSLEADGFNPFGELCSTHSVWPIFVINNNLEHNIGNDYSRYFFERCNYSIS